MTMTRTIVAASLMLIATGCAADDRHSDTTAAHASAAARDTSVAGRARSAAAVANAIAAKPAAADSILRAAGYTREEFEKLLYDIAADSAMSAVYTAAKTR